ncbi:MAG TPA: type II secretion system F family protein [Vicinamibacterales bacterium]|nr:type II secretion system F family protein [Vicinamibacterales bacterium]
MLAAFLVFVVVTALVAGAGVMALRLPETMANRRMERRLSELSQRDEDQPQASFIRERKAGPLPALDKAFSGTESSLARLIEQSGVAVAPSTIILASLMLALVFAFASLVVFKQPFVWPLAAVAGAMLPWGWLRYRRSARMRRFEEQFPEALDLLSRAIRAGHAFQTAMGMCADELPAPVGTEFRKSFDQQNFGLPLKDTLHEMAERMPLLDVKFFVTAVLIQRETGGNLAEILDNLAHVVRERFKILRQVRVHTAHGRFTGYVLLALPAALGVALSFINPEHMDLLFRERMGQMMIVGAIVMQTIGYFWIRKVIKIEV